MLGAATRAVTKPRSAELEEGARRNRRGRGEGQRR